MTPRLLAPADLPELRRLRRALWPDCADEEAEALLDRPATRYVVLVADRPGGGLCAFAEVGTRPYAEGCESSPVAYLEGIWVDPDHRRGGVAAALTKAAEAWARACGLTELASDFSPGNEASRAFHEAAGFAPADEAVCVRKDVSARGRDAGLLRAMVGAADPREGVAIRPVTLADWDAVWSIIQEVVRPGDTYAYPPDMTRAEALDTWIGAARATFVAEVDGRVLGTYYVKTNQPGQGSHVCNAGYMVSAAARGRGLGEAMCRHSLVEARRLGYAAMQYNLVVSTNTGAVRLWERMGFDIVGTLPGAFRHPDAGAVDALVMYRTL